VNRHEPVVPVVDVDQDRPEGEVASRRYGAPVLRKASMT